MNRKEYSAGAVKHAFWFMEFRNVVALRLAGKSWEEIKRLSENENIFGAPTRTRATQIFNTVSARVKSLDDSFYPIFEACDLASQKLFALVAAMSYDKKLAHLTLSRIQPDLDEGVKKNYRKIQTANDGKFYEVLADSKNIMSKE